jgi:hypothetical protein
MELLGNPWVVGIGCGVALVVALCVLMRWNDQ